MTGKDWQALLREASALRRAGRTDAAIEAYERLLATNPALPDSWYNLAWLQRQARRFEDALASYREALERGVANPQEVHVNRAVILTDYLARQEEARAELEQALRIDPEYLPALLNLGNLAEDMGCREDARSAYQRALAASPDHPLALARLANVSAPDDGIVADLRAALGRELTAADRADLGFALARLLDISGDYDAAFDSAVAANAASRASFGPTFRGYDRAAQAALVDRLIATFDRPAISEPSADHRQLIFICGMFRSGSTLCEQILARHSAVAAGGELDLIPTIVERELQPYPDAAADLRADRIADLRRFYLNGLEQRGLDAAIVTDKRPDNFLHIGLIKTVFPNARIVHTRRAALDNIVSLHFLQLSPAMAYALNVEDAAHWLAQHDRLMAHWRTLYPDDIFELDYDALVADPRSNIAALLAFCGLEWEDAVLDFHTASGPVKTASVWQVRQPLHGRSSGRWRNYAKQLGPLASKVRRPG